MIGRLAANSPNFFTRSRTQAYTNTLSGADSVGVYGLNRGESTGYLFRRVVSGIATETPVTEASQTPFDGTIGVFRSGVNETTFTYNNGRIAFYSIGTSLSLSDLDTAVTNLITAIAAAL